MSPREGISGRRSIFSVVTSSPFILDCVMTILDLAKYTAANDQKLDPYDPVRMNKKQNECDVYVYPERNCTVRAHVARWWVKLCHRVEFFLFLGCTVRVCLRLVKFHYARLSALGHFFSYLRTVLPVSILTPDYSWIGHGLQSGPTLAFLPWLSDFKTKTSFGFLVKKPFFSSKSQKMSSYDQKQCFWRF